MPDLRQAGERLDLAMRRALSLLRGPAAPLVWGVVASLLVIGFCVGMTL